MKFPVLLKILDHHCLTLKESGISRLNRNILFLCQCVFPAYLSFSSVTYAGLLKKVFGTLHRRLSVISCVSCVLLNEICTKPCNEHLLSCEKFVHAILCDSSHPLRKDLSNCHSLTRTRSSFRSTHSRITFCGELTFLCRARILTNRK